MKLKFLVALALAAAATCLGQAIGGNGVPGASSGGGATLPTNAVVYGLSSSTSRASTPSDLLPLVGYYTGAYSSGTTYKFNDIAVDGSGNNYVSLAAANTGNALTNTTWWHFLGGLSATVTGGTCTAGQVVTSISTVGVPTCAIPVTTTGPAIANGDIVVGFGDSYVQGSPGTTCSESFNSSPVVPTGTCILDAFALNYGATTKVVNLGVGSTCATTYTPTTGACTTNGNNGLGRYAAQLLPQCTGTSGGHKVWIWFEYSGINEGQFYGSEPGFTQAIFQSAINTMISACVAAGEPASQIIMVDSMHASNDENWQNYEASSATAQIASALGTLYALVYEPTITCWNDQLTPQGSVCSSDGVHPDATHGVPIYIAALENASQANALVGRSWITIAAFAQQPYKGINFQGYPGTNAAISVGLTTSSAGSQDIVWNIGSASSTLLGPIQSGSALDVYDNTGGAFQFSVGQGAAATSVKRGINAVQACSGNTACRAQLAAGVFTWTFSPAWTHVPSCTVSEESATSLHTANPTSLSASAITVTSFVTTSNTDFVDIHCIGQNN